MESVSTSKIRRQMIVEKSINDNFYAVVPTWKKNNGFSIRFKTLNFVVVQ